MSTSLDTHLRATRRKAGALEAEQANLFADHVEPEPADEPEPSAPTLFVPAGDALACHAAFEAWTAEHGHFNANARTHAWRFTTAVPAAPTDHCATSVLCADLRCDHWREDCYCVGNDLLHRAGCLHCAWLGDPRVGENPAAEDGQDHAYPGWRDLPIVDRPTADKQKALDRWTQQLSAAGYDPAWLEKGGPIRTWRTPPGTRHVPAGTPWGGYDLGVIKTDLEEVDGA